MGIKVTPDDIRARGHTWPLPGYNEDSFPRNEQNQLDLDEAIELVASSHRFWSGEQTAARAVAAAATTVSLSDHDDFKRGRREAGSKAERLRATLDRLEEIRASFE